MFNLHSNLHNLIEQACFEGPVYLQNLLDKIAESNLIKIRPSTESDRQLSVDYISLVNDSLKKNLKLKYFLLGHFQQLAATTAQGEGSTRRLRENAYLNYELFLSHPIKNKDLLYYAHWQKGKLLRSLGLSWCRSEEQYLNAFAEDPCRAESLKDIILYQIEKRKWPAAYLYSTYIKQNLYKTPNISNRMWHWDYKLYKWEILDIHTAICMHLKNYSEAQATFFQLHEATTQDPTDFSNTDLARLQTNYRIFKSEGNLSKIA